MIWYKIPDTNPSIGPTVFYDCHWDDRDGYIREGVGTVSKSMKVYLHDVPDGTLYPQVGSADDFVNGLSYEDYINGGDCPDCEVWCTAHPAANLRLGVTAESELSINADVTVPCCDNPLPSRLWFTVNFGFSGYSAVVELNYEADAGLFTGWRGQGPYEVSVGFGHLCTGDIDVLLYCTGSGFWGMVMCFLTGCSIENPGTCGIVQSGSSIIEVSCDPLELAWGAFCQTCYTSSAAMDGLIVSYDPANPPFLIHDAEANLYLTVDAESVRTAEEYDHDTTADLYLTVTSESELLDDDLLIEPHILLFLSGQAESSLDFFAEDHEATANLYISGEAFSEMLDDTFDHEAEAELFLSGDADSSLS